MSLRPQKAGHSPQKFLASGRSSTVRWLDSDASLSKKPELTAKNNCSSTFSAMDEEILVSEEILEEGTLAPRRRSDPFLPSSDSSDESDKSDGESSEEEEITPCDSFGGAWCSLLLQHQCEQP